MLNVFLGINTTYIIFSQISQKFNDFRNLVAPDNSIYFIFDSRTLTLTLISIKGT